MRILCNSSLLTESQAFLSPTNSLRVCTVSLYSNFFSNIWRTKRQTKNWSAIDMLRWNLYWWLLIISSTYRLKFQRRILDNILFEADSSLGSVQHNAYEL
jgi:hypothetical protein